jgi:hypothetical protein
MPISYIPQAPESRGGGFGENLLATFMQSMLAEKQNQVQKEQLKLEQGRLELQRSQVSAQLEAEAREAARVAAQDQAAGAAGAFILAQLSAQSSGLQQSIQRHAPQTVLDPRVLMQQAASGIRGGAPATQALRPFDTRHIPAAQAAALAQAIPQFQQQQADLGFRQAQTESVNLDNTFASSTMSSRLSAAALAPRIAAAQLQGQQLENTFAHLRNTRDPIRASGAQTLWQQGGVTWREARETYGLAAGGIDDSAIYTPPTDLGAGGGQETRRIMQLSDQMDMADGVINRMYAEGVRISPLNSFQRGTQSAIADIAINSISDPAQQQIVHAMRLFGDSYRFMLSGAGSTDREAMRMLNSVVPQANDSDAAIAQKQVMRRTIIALARTRAGGNPASSIAIARQGLETARQTGDPTAIELFTNILDTALQHASGTALPISAEPTDSTNVQERMPRVDELLRQGGLIF